MIITLRLIRDGIWYLRLLGSLSLSFKPGPGLVASMVPSLQFHLARYTVSLRVTPSPTQTLPESVSLSVRPSICLSVCLSVCVSVCLSVCLSPSLSGSL